MYHEHAYYQENLACLVRKVLGYKDNEACKYACIERNEKNSACAVEYRQDKAYQHHGHIALQDACDILQRRLQLCREEFVNHLFAQTLLVLQEIQLELEYGREFVQV